MLAYGDDEGNPALEASPPAVPRDEDKEYMELFYTYQALLDEVKRLHAIDESRVRQGDPKELRRNDTDPGAIQEPLGTPNPPSYDRPLAVAMGPA